ncbi:MAG: substrate-binding domain-containing protein [Lachnospiraceae bacterium]|nr:substrate-binding domain-containing protein [Lachnospiraceae bacterium]
MKRKIALFAIGAMMVGAMAGCGSGSSASNSTAGSTAAADDGAMAIGYSCVDMNNTFQTYLVAAAEDKAEELGASITVTDAQNDVVKQQDQVKALIQQGVDCLVVVPSDSSAMGPITNAATEAGIPLVYCNVNPFEDFADIPEGVHYIGSDETEAGTYQAEMLGEEIQSGGVAILHGGLEYEATYKRTAGNEDTFAAQYSDISVLTKEDANWQRDEAINIVNNWITAYGDELTGICANNDEMALGAVEALKAAGREDVKVVGIDATPDGCASVQAGEMLATVYQDSVGQGGGAVEIAVGMANGEAQAETYTMIPYQKVTAENVEDFIGLN